MNIYRMQRNVKFETGHKPRIFGSGREAEMLSTVQRKVSQGVTAEQQYADLNTARDKRKRRRERNLKTLVSGGYKQVLLIGGRT